MLALLVRARLAALPQGRRPAGARGHADADAHAATVLETLASIMDGAGGRPLAGSAGPAPIYQAKVGLRGAKPPIWRRLLVPADVSLARLHDVIQTAFGWEDSHMHMFETPYGEVRACGPGVGAPG